MIPVRRVEDVDGLRYSAIWLADSCGDDLYLYFGFSPVTLMDDVFLSARIDNHRSICISPLPAKIYKQAGGKGLGGEFGYFIYETSDEFPEAGIEVIGKAASLEAALRLFEVLSRKAA